MVFHECLALAPTPHPVYPSPYPYPIYSSPYPYPIYTQANGVAGQGLGFSCTADSNTVHPPDVSEGYAAHA